MNLQYAIAADGSEPRAGRSRAGRPPSCRPRPDFLGTTALDDRLVNVDASTWVIQDEASPRLAGRLCEDLHILLAFWLAAHAIAVRAERRRLFSPAAARRQNCPSAAGQDAVPWLSGPLANDGASR